MKKKFVLSLLVVGLAIGGCQKKEETEVEVKPSGKEVTTEQLASNVRNKHDDDRVYTDEKLLVERDENLILEIGFNPLDEGIENFTEIVEIFQNPELTQRVNVGFEADEDFNEIQVTPPKSVIAGISNADLPKDVYGNDATSYHLFDKGSNKDWGNLKQYYMAVHVNLETGEPLAKPEVTLVNIKQEILGSPRVKMTLNNEGLPQLDWTSVRGADYYYVLVMDYDEKYGYIDNGQVVGQTEETTWTAENVDKLRTYKVSEYERRAEHNKEKYGEGTTPIAKEDLYEKRYVVVAVNEEGTSAISNGLNLADLAKRIPYHEEVALSTEQEGSSIADAFDELPAYKWITMCDGTLVQKLINYDISKAKEETETWGSYEKEDMSDLKGIEVDLIKIPYVIEGTGFSGIAKVADYDEKQLQENLNALEARQEKLRNRAGSTDVEMTVEETDEADEGTSEEDQKVYESEDKITANSALSEYLAISMLSGTRSINVKDFPEALDQEFLFDAWMEAIYQNPLILGVKGASISSSGETLLVTYDTSASEMLKKQAELRTEVKKVVSEIISEDMSDLEKEYAINQYLCEIAEYDDAALENAEKNNFIKVDSEFDDSFTPYGVLINKVGVCASYAGAFKLLADEADLEAIVTTGYLEGNLPHAWNKVKIDGEWHVLDSTNNDNELLTNALLNIPSNVAQKVLVEDDRYVLDRNLADYKLTDEDADSEFYHVESKYFDEEQVINQLLKSLEENGSATLRTNYDLDDNGFMRIGSSIFDQTQNENLQGLYWMGVIHLENGNK